MCVSVCLPPRAGFEVYDFPPVWGLFDAHSLWHLATGLVTWLWYDFAAADQQVHQVQLAKAKRG
jgi:hypothetical protein